MLPSFTEKEGKREGPRAMAARMAAMGLQTKCEDPEGVSREKKDQ